MPSRLTPAQPLRKRRDFLRVQTNGRRFKRDHMVLMVGEGGETGARVGFTVSRKVGNAVTRNRVRRRLREIIRLHPDWLSPGTDHVIIAFSSAAEADYSSLEDDLRCLLARAVQWVSSKQCSWA